MNDIIQQILEWQPLIVALFGVVFCRLFGGPIAFYWWILWLVPLYFSFQKVFHDISLRSAKNEAVATTRQAVEASSDAAAWVNDCVRNIWNTNEGYFINHFMNDASKLFQDNKPPVARSLTLDSINLGTKIPIFSNITVHDQEPSHFFIEAHMNWLSELSLHFKVDCGSSHFPLVIRNLSITSTVQIHVWLLDHQPFISHCKFSLVDPIIDMTVEELQQGPDMRTVVEKMMKAIISDLVIHPNFYELIFAKRTNSNCYNQQTRATRDLPLEQGPITEVEKKRKIRNKIRRGIHPNETDKDIFDNNPRLAQEAASKSKHEKITEKTENSEFVVHNNTATAATAPKFAVNEAPLDCLERSEKGKPQGLGVDLQMLENKYAVPDSPDQSLALQAKPRKKLQRSLSDRSHKHFRHLYKIKENLKG